MKKIFLLLISLLISKSPSLAIDIVYPSSNPFSTTSSATFFIGSTTPDKPLLINDESIYVSKQGAFAHSVKLNLGANKFILKSDDEIKEFNIIRKNSPKFQSSNLELVEYSPTPYEVLNDNTPLRMTPINAGINRLSHLQKGVKVVVNGEKSGFYRVYLNSELEGWITKDNLMTLDLTCDSLLPAEILKKKVQKNNEYLTYQFELSKKVPYIVKEVESGLVLEIFNLQGEQDSTYKLQVPLEKIFGYNVEWQDNCLVFKVRKFPVLSQKKILKNIVITIDAGHGGCESGSVGCCGEKEKDINLVIAKYLKNELKSRGANVVMTREDDVKISLQDRVKIAKDSNSSILISIHANALPDIENPINNRGTSVYYYHNQAKTLADCILEQITTQTGTNNDKVRRGSLALVRSTCAVSVLVEVAYMINPDDYALLTDDTFRKNCAKAIADGVENYLKK